MSNLIERLRRYGKPETQEGEAIKSACREAANALLAQDREIHRLQNWVNDLQAGMYINCVYCGHRYGPDTEVPAAMADVLKEHIEQCPEHPLSKATEQLARAQKYCRCEPFCFVDVGLCEKGRHDWEEYAAGGVKLLPGESDRLNLKTVYKQCARCGLRLG